MKELSYELKAIRKIESNFGVRLTDGFVLQPQMFKWNKTYKDKEIFDKIINILHRPEPLRDVKNDVGLLKTHILSKHEVLSEHFAAISRHHSRLNDADLTELGKVVTYRFCKKGT